MTPTLLSHLMRFACFLLPLAFAGLPRAYGQTSPAALPALTLTMAPGVRLPADTTVTRPLLAALTGLLEARRQSPNVTAYLAAPPRPEALILLDELYGLEQPRAALPATTYRFQVLGITDLDSSSGYVVQVGSLGVAPDGQPVLRATGELLASRTTPGGGFTFGSALRGRTLGWRSTRHGLCLFRYPNTLDTKAAATYARYLTEFDRKLGSPDWPTEIFCCSYLSEALRLVGITYKADYAGYAHSSLSTRANHELLVLDASANRFDPHDLWHQRLRNAVPEASHASINKAVDEGCAFRYAGSWGLTWPQILGQFKAWAAAHPNPDWLNLYLDGANHATPGQKPLLVRYTLNALIIEQLEKDKGFSAVRQLLTCGKTEKGDDNYFRALTEATGITRATFNARMSELVAKAKP